VITLVWVNRSRKRLIYGDFGAFLLRAEEALGGTKVQNAVAERVKAIADAAKDIPSEFKQKSAEVSWYELSEIIDQIASKTLGVQPVQTWILIRSGLPVLKERSGKFMTNRRAETPFWRLGEGRFAPEKVSQTIKQKFFPIGMEAMGQYVRAYTKKHDKSLQAYLNLTPSKFTPRLQFFKPDFQAIARSWSVAEERLRQNAHRLS
jgi:uncharacterized protein with HEPN domain